MVDSAKSDGPLIAADSVTVRFGRNTVLRDVSISAAQGETLVIIGESGCGKTVLLKSLIGLIRPTSGRVTFDSLRISELGERRLSKTRTRFGYVFQNAALFDSMSVADNVAFPLREHRRMGREEAYELVVERLAEVGLPATAMLQKPAELSGGQRKRVGLARALAMQPEILLYDEPTTGLDPIMSDVINELILRTRGKHGVTSIVVTHDMRSAVKLADRIVMLYPLSRLKGGDPQVIFEGTPHEIETCRDKRVAQFVRGEAGERLEEIREARDEA